MYLLDLFASVHALQLNLKDETSPIGELSALGRSFARDVGQYSNVQSAPDVVLYGFRSQELLATVPVKTPHINTALAVSQFLVTASKNGQLTDSIATTQNLLQAQFGADIQIITVGKMVTNGVVYLPETLVFTVLNQPANEVQIWYSDIAFRGQCDVHEIIPVKVIDVLDDLLKTREIALGQLKEINVVTNQSRVNAVIGNIPNTQTITQEYLWVDKNDPSITYPTPFTVVVYGQAGINADLIRDKLVEHILANSNQPRSEWEKVYPDLFLPIEFFVAPYWNQYALPNQLTQAGIYSPTVSYKNFIGHVKDNVECALDAADIDPHITEHGEVSFINHKSLAFAVVGHKRNRNDAYKFSQVWQRYTALSQLSADYNRMDLETQRFIMLLSELVRAAETMTQFSDIPNGVTRVKRISLLDGKTRYYASATFGRIKYLVALKQLEIPEV